MGTNRLAQIALELIEIGAAGYTVGGCRVLVQREVEYRQMWAESSFGDARDYSAVVIGRLLAQALLALQQGQWGPLRAVVAMHGTVRQKDRYQHAEKVLRTDWTHAALDLLATLVDAPTMLGRRSKSFRLANELVRHKLLQVHVFSAKSGSAGVYRITDLGRDVLALHAQQGALEPHEKTSEAKSVT